MKIGDFNKSGVRCQVSGVRFGIGKLRCRFNVDFVGGGL